MKIQLIQPPEPTYNPPMGGFGLACLAAHVEDIAETSILDPTQYNMTMREVLSQVEAWDPDMIGVTLISTPSIYRVLDFVEQVKRMKPECIVVLGGHSATFLVDEVLNSGWVDVVVRGEGEIPFRKLVQNDGNPEGIGGLSFRRNGQIVHNGPGEVVENMDDLRMPAYHLLDQTARFIHLVEYSRGCPYRCNFCATARFYNNTWRSKSPERVAQEIQFLVDNYTVSWIIFSDDNMGVDMSRVEQLCHLLIEAEVDTQLLTMIRADQIVKNPDTISLMAKAGFRAVQIGLESPHQEALNEMNKGTTRSENERAVELLHENDIFIWGFFIIGAPGETPDMMHQTYEFAKEMDIDGIGFSIYTPLPGTELYKDTKEKGLLISHDWEEYDCHHRVAESTLPETMQLSYQFNRDYYYRTEWITKHLAFDSHPARLMLARIFWSQNVNNQMGGCPDNLDSWREIMEGYGIVLNEELASALPDYSADVAIETELGLMSLSIQKGRIADWSTDKKDSALGLHMDNETLTQIVISMGLDFLSALLFQRVQTDASLSDLLDFCRWMNVVQTKMALAPGGPAHEMPACVGAINELMLASPDYERLKERMRGFRKPACFQAPHGSITLRVMGPRMLYWGLEDPSWSSGTALETTVSDALLKDVICGDVPALASAVKAEAEATQNSDWELLYQYLTTLQKLNISQAGELQL